MRVAVLGATGSVGRCIVQLLHERHFPACEVIPLASPSSEGRKISMGEKDLNVRAAQGFDFTGVDLLFSAAGAEVAKRYVPLALKAGARVIDKSSAFRMDPGVPLVIPEVNGHLVSAKTPLVASPNCIVIPLVSALAPLCKAGRLVRLVVSTYQSVSGAGKKGMDALYDQTRALLMAGVPKPGIFSHPIAFNVIPAIGEVDGEGWSDEETKIQQETAKILDNLPEIHKCRGVQMSVTAVRVPVLIGHGLSVMAEFEEAFSPKTAQSLLSKAPGLCVFPKAKGGVTPLEGVGDDQIFVSRMRAVHGSSCGVSFWMVCDNLRKGAGLNAVQIAESFFKKKGTRPSNPSLLGT